MKFAIALFLALACAVIAGCGSVLPKPDTAKQAGIEAVVAYGLTSHIANQYLSAPVCTSPVTVLPCKFPDIATKLKAYDNAAYASAMAVHEAVNNPNFDKSKLDALSVSAGEALKLLNAYIASQAVQSTLKGASP